MDDQAALKMVESARQRSSSGASFAGNLFMGRFDFGALFPFPEQSADDRLKGDELILKVQPFLENKLDADRIDREEKIPDEVVAGLRELGLFGMKIPANYGGLGLSQSNYNRVIHLVASHCASTAVMLSAHQSIGVPQPLLTFGTEQQKEKFLPRLAAGALSAFALTEPGVGSDPSHMSTTAKLTEDENAYLINGEKLWISNGPDAEIIIVMARTQAGSSGHPSVSAFILETNTPGFEAAHECRFMGLTGISNGLLKFNNVRVPKENLLGREGMGMKIALTTLNTGRLTLPAASAAVAKQCLAILRPWINERKQWGKSIGRHDAVAGRMASMAAHTYALDALMHLTSAMADAKDVDIRIEAAMAKLYSSEVLWKIVDDTVQTRGGRGYETSQSLQGRGEKPLPVERLMRDARINLIIEGTSDIMRLFLAREALDRHLEVMGVKPSEKGGGSLFSTVLSAAKFYATWYPRLWWRQGKTLEGKKLPGKLQKHLNYVEKESRRLARLIFHAMLLHRKKLQDRQRVLGRIVDIGTRLFTISAVISKAAADHANNSADNGPLELADLFCRTARREIRAARQEMFHNMDTAEYRTAIGVMEGRFAWLEKDIVTTWQEK